MKRKLKKPPTAVSIELKSIKLLINDLFIKKQHLGESTEYKIKYRYRIIIS